MIRKISIAFFIIILILSFAAVPACRRTAKVDTLFAHLEGKVVVWDAIEDAAAYSVKCTMTDGTGYTIRTLDTAYEPPYSTSGDHMYVISALDADGKVLAKSEPLLYHLGAGSYADPILISGAAELQEITGSITMTFGEVKVTAPLYYRLTRDIDLTGVDFTPIGSSSKPFSGVFDGNGHKITGLRFTKSNADGKVGLFADATDAVIKNLTIQNASMLLDKDSGVTGGDLRFGLLVASAMQTYIDNCHVTGEMDILTKVVTTDSNKVLVGGVCGSATAGAITRCSFKGNIKAQYGWVYAGGILGEAKSSSPRFAMLNCSSNATVEGVGTAYNVTSGAVEAYARVGVVIGNVASAERIASIFAIGSAKASSYRDGAAVSRLTQGVFGRTLMSGTASAIPLYHIYYDEAIGKVSGSATSLGTAYENNAHALTAEMCSELRERSISGYNGTTVNIKYDDCNPFGMIAEDFGDLDELSDHATISAPNSTIASFNSLSEHFATFMAHYEIPTNGTTYAPTIDSAALNDYTVFYNAAVALYGESYVSFARNASNTLSRSAVIGANHPYAMLFGNDVNTNLVDLQTVVANLFGFGSKTEFANYAKDLASTYAQYRTDVIHSNPVNKALMNGCFYTSNGSFVFPIAIKSNLSSSVLTYVIVDTKGFVSVWINDITSALWAINYNASYYTSGTINNESYCKKVLFETGLVSEQASYLEGEEYGLDFAGAWTMTDGSIPTLTGAGMIPHPPETTLQVKTADGETSYTFVLPETFLPKCYPVTLSRLTDYEIGYQVDTILSSLNIAHAAGTRVRFSAEGLADVEVEVGASNTLPYLVYAVYGAPEMEGEIFGGYKIVDTVLLETHDFTTAQKIVITVLPAESAE